MMCIPKSCLNVPIISLTPTLKWAYLHFMYLLLCYHGNFKLELTSLSSSNWDSARINQRHSRHSYPHYFGFFLHLLQFCKLYQMTPKAILFSAASVWKVLIGGCALFSLLGINSTLTFVPKFEHKLRCCSLCPRPPLSLSAALTKVKQFFSGNENDLAVSAWLCLASTLYWQHVATPTNIWHDSNNFQTLHLALSR